MSFEQVVVRLEETNAELVKEVVRVRDAAMGLNHMYPTVAEGRQAVSDGQYFTVPGNGAYQKLYRRNGSQADLIAEYPTVDAIVATFDNVADMKSAAVLQTGQKVRTHGYYSPGDGGGNEYEIVAGGTGTDDGGSYIDLSGSGLQAKGLFKAEGRASVKQFGAKGDGVSDDSVPFQSAINSGLPILVPKGVFPVDGLTVGATSFDILGLGEASVLLHKANTVAATAFDMNAADGTFVIDNCKIDCNRSNHAPPPESVMFFSASQNPNGFTFIMRNCRVEHAHTHALFMQTDNITRATVKVIDNSFYDISEGVDYRWNPSFVTFSENVDFEASGNDFRAGYSFTQDGAMAINHTSRLRETDPVNEYARVRIVGNYFEGLGRRADGTGNPLGCIELRLWTETTVISDNNFFETYYTPIRGKTDSKETVISNNSMHNCQASGIEITRGVSSGPFIGRATITGNVISSQEVGGIKVAGRSGEITQDWNITGNTISNSGQMGVEVQFAENVVISNNVISNSADIGIRVLQCDYITINGNSSDGSGGDSGISVINVPHVICNNNLVNDADDVGIRVGGVTKAVVSGNAVTNRNDVSGHNVDYRLTSGTTLVAVGNMGTTSVSFGFTTRVVANNEFG